jgi:hypothetical protein
MNPFSSFDKNVSSATPILLANILVNLIALTHVDRSNLTLYTFGWNGTV